YHGYQDRYRSIPGDDPTANRWALGRVGDGNGVVSGTYNNACPPAATPPAAPAAGTPESCLFWNDLRLAGFVAGNGSQQPFNAVTGLLGVQTGDGNSPPGPALAPAGGGGFVTLVVCSANLPDKIAIAADTQMDDGDSRSGTVRGQIHDAGPNPNIKAATDANSYAETGTNVYTICRAF
ncbi:MAG TPA: hypothetical protein VE935_08280, partial [Burkholderiales bacterium]|nr:hypothetical protein [Burkholderiales bacterium]